MRDTARERNAAMVLMCIALLAGCTATDKVTEPQDAGYVRFVFTGDTYCIRGDLNCFVDGTLLATFTPPGSREVAVEAGFHKVQACDNTAVYPTGCWDEQSVNVQSGGLKEYVVRCR